MATEFRNAGKLWHWCPECPDWPRNGFTSTVLAAGTPEEEICMECRRLDKGQTCTRQQ